MRTADKALARIRQIGKRIEFILAQDSRTSLMEAEVIHQAAHLAEHLAELDEALLAGGPLPDSWATARSTHGLSAAINAAMQEPQ